MSDRCEIKRCRLDSCMTYVGVEICFAHWVVYCLKSEKPPHQQLRKLVYHAIKPPAQKRMKLEWTRFQKNK